MSKRPEQRTQPLEGADRVLWYEIESGVFAPAVYIGGGLSVDSVGLALTVIDYVHHEIHKGNHFSASYKTPDASPIGDNNSLQFLIRVPADVQGHTSWNAAGGGDMEVCLYENPTLTDDGTLIASVNMNRNKTSHKAQVDVYHTPTIADPGVQLYNDFEPGGTGPRAGGGTVRANEEWVLGPGRDYILCLTNRAGSDQPMSIVVQWYEEEPT